MNFKKFFEAMASIPFGHPTKANSHITWMMNQHKQEVIDLYEKHMSKSLDQEAFRALLNKRMVLFQVAVTRQEEVIGFMVYEFHKNSLTAILIVGESEGIITDFVEKLLGKIRGRKKSLNILFDLNQKDVGSVISKYTGKIGSETVPLFGTEMYGDKVRAFYPKTNEEPVIAFPDAI